MIKLNEVSKVGWPAHNSDVGFYIKGSEVMQVGYHSIRSGQFKCPSTERRICYKCDVTHWFELPSLSDFIKEQQPLIIN